MGTALLDVPLRVGRDKNICCIAGLSWGYFCAGSPFFVNNEGKRTLSALLSHGIHTLSPRIRLLSHKPNSKHPVCMTVSSLRNLCRPRLEKPWELSFSKLSPLDSPAGGLVTGTHSGEITPGCPGLLQESFIVGARGGLELDTDNPYIWGSGE